MDQLKFGTPNEAKEGTGEWITAYCDGGSRGNPGPAGFGVYIQDENGSVVAELSEFIGRKTNNVAEYSGLLAALQFAVDGGYEWLRVISDSELMVKQMKGQYRVNSPELRPLYEEAKKRVGRLRSFQIQHVLRDKNKHADRLANQAMDAGTGRRAAEPAAAASKPAAVGPIPIVRVAAEAKAAPAKAIRGFVKGGVIHLVEGDLPDGVFVKIVRE